MTVEQLRRTRSTQPFQPFTIFLADGRTLDVPHPEFLYIPPKTDRSVFVSDDAGLVETVDVLLIVSLKPKRGHSNGRRKAG